MHPSQQIFRPRALHQSQEQELHQGYKQESDYEQLLREPEFPPAYGGEDDRGEDYAQRRDDDSEYHVEHHDGSELRAVFLEGDDLLLRDLLEHALYGAADIGA